MRSPSAFSDVSVKPSFPRTTPAKKPRTECCCQPVAFMMAAIVAPLGCLSRVRITSCLVPPRLEDEGMLPGLAGLCARPLGRLSYRGFCGATFEDPFRLRRHLAPSPPKPHSGGIASGAGSNWGQAALIACRLTLHSQWKSSPFCDEYCEPITTTFRSSLGADTWQRLRNVASWHCATGIDVLHLRSVLGALRT
jgi:hypothetical protein